MAFKKIRDVVHKNVVGNNVYNAKFRDIEHKIPDITNLATTAAFNAKINWVKNEIPSITNLGTNASLNAKINEVKNKISSIINLGTLLLSLLLKIKNLMLVI